MRHIENRLRKMESSLNPEPAVCIGVATVRHALLREPTKNLATGERVVVDWFRKIGGTLWGRERISNDPADQGPGAQHAPPVAAGPEVRRGISKGAPRRIRAMHRAVAPGVKRGGFRRGEDHGGPSRPGVHAAPRRGHRVGAPGQGDRNRSLGPDEV
jgi:hypothetical protein